MRAPEPPAWKAAATADLVLVGVALAWGVSFTVVKDALAVVPPSWLVVLRFALAAAALGLLLGPRRLVRAGRRAWRAGLVVGALLFLGFVLQTLGLQFTTPARSAFLTGCSVLMVPALERVLLGTRVSSGLVAGVLLAVLGLGLLLQPGSFADLAGGLNRGDVLTLGCALAFAGHILALGRHARRVPARELAALQLLVVALLAAPLALATETVSFVYPARVWGALLFLGLVCSALAFGAQTWAQQRTPPSRTALILALEPLFAALVSVAVGVERLGAWEWLGGGLVVAGVVIGERSRLADTLPKGLI